MSNYTNEQIEGLFDEAFSIGVCMDEEYGCDVVTTADSLASFIEAAKGYSEHGAIEHGEVDGLKTIVIHGAQPKKGDKRRDVYIIDLGDVRVVNQ